MFDPADLWVYAGVGLLAAISTVLAITLYVNQTRQHQRYADRRSASHRRLGAPGVAMPREPYTSPTEVTTN